MPQEPDNSKIVLNDGISVIIPTYKGEKWILKCLNSLQEQTLNKNLFEIIVIINGEKDDTETLLDTFIKKHIDINLQKIVLEKAGVSYARNKGLEKASRLYTTFIDDDDWVSHNYLELLYEKASEDTIVIAELIDIDKDEKQNSDNHINIQVKEARKKDKIDLLDISHIFSISASKLIPTKYTSMLKYDTSLSSGEDIVYFSSLIAQYDLTIKSTKGAKYYRVLRENSISRQNVSFHFNIEDRLSVIEPLNTLFALTHDLEKIKFLKYMIIGQVFFIKTYLEQYPEEFNKVKQTIGKEIFYYFPYFKLGIQTLEHIEIESSNSSLHECRMKYRDLGSTLTETRNQLTETRNQLTETRNQLTETRNQFNEIKKSMSYKLGYALLHEKRKYTNPKTLFKKLKTLKKVLNERKTKQKTTKEKSIKEPHNIKVALICDEFSYNSFRYEFETITFKPNNWKDAFVKNKPDLFLCESAWSGDDSKDRPWKGKIYSSINFKKENRVELLEILQYCNEHNIPTIFWNKEDPTHYTDKVHNFVDTAIKFDHIFTTAEECVDMYKNEYHCKNVYCLPFATQPRLFNPIEKYERSDAIVFAGSWYAQHKERCIDMEKMFDAILMTGKELIIYDRHFGAEDTNHHFPDKYQKYVRPSIPHDQIDKVYKSSTFGLNINTVKNSPTMFARRVFELMSSNTFVLSNNSLGTKNFFGDKILYLDEDPKALQALTSAQIEHIRNESLHLVLEKHTYYNRFKEILDKINFSYIDIDNTVTIIMFANSENDIEKIQNIYKSQSGIPKKLLIVLSREITDTDVALYYEKYNNEETGVIALSYLETYDQKWESIITTPYFSILDKETKLSKDILKNALLHTSYIDEPILLDSSKRYIYSDVTIVKNIISKKSDFKKLLENYDKSINGKFYHV